MIQRSFTQRSRRFFGVFAILTALFTLTATAAVAIESLSEVETSYDDMNSTASEFSGATYNADRNVLLVVDDEVNAYEFDLNPDGSIDHSEDVRILTLSLGGTADWEGVAWISGERYAFLSEGTGTAYIIDVPTSSNTIDSNDIVQQITVGGPQGNTGTEGIAIGSDGSMYVTDEFPASVTKYTSSGGFVAQLMLPAIGDASGVVAAEDDSLIVISHESSKALHIDVTWGPSGSTYDLISEINLNNFSQLEGVAIIGNDQLHFFGEDKGGQTYSRQVGTIVAAPTYELMDVNCSGTSDVVDALLITQIEVGTSEPIVGCGSGDTNNDGQTNVVDALMITQCEVGIANVGCPNQS